MEDKYYFTQEQKEALYNLIELLKKQNEEFDKFIQVMEGE